MKHINIKTLLVLSNGSSFFCFKNSYKNFNQFLFNDKDEVSLYKNKKSIYKIKLDSFSNYKNDYF